MFILIRSWFTFLAGAMEGSESSDAKLTPASTKISSSPVESSKKLASQCSSQRVRQKTVHNNDLGEKSDKKKQEAWDAETADVYSVDQEDPTAKSQKKKDPTAKIDITKIMHSMKCGKCSARQGARSSTTWTQPLGFLRSKNVVRARRNHQGDASNSKKMKRTHGKKDVGGEGDASDQSIPAEAVTSDNYSRVEPALGPEPLCADSMASCVEFAVKLLKDQTPLPAEVSEVEFFKQMMYRDQESTIAGPSQSSLSRKG